MWQDLTEWTESGGCRRLRVWLWSAGCHTETTDGRCEALWSCHCGYSWSCCFSTSWWQEIHINKKKTSETFPNMDKYGVVTHNIRSPSRPRNIPLRTESIWLAVRWSSLTEDAPSNAPSSISVILLLLRLLCVCGGRKKACRRIKSSTYSLESDCWKVRGFLLTFSSAGKGS